MPVRPSTDRLMPGVGGTTVDTRRSAFRRAVTVGHHLLRRRVRGDRSLVIDHDHLQSRRAQPGKLPPDHIPGRHRLACRVLPARTGQGAFDPRGEHPKDHQHHRPRHQHGPQMARRPTTQPGQHSATRRHRLRCRLVASPTSRCGRKRLHSSPPIAVATPKPAHPNTQGGISFPAREPYPHGYCQGLRGLPEIPV